MQQQPTPARRVDSPQAVQALRPRRRRPYWDFERAGARRFAQAAPVYRLFRVHG